VPRYASPKPPPLARWLRLAFEGFYGEASWAVVHWFAMTWSIGPDIAQLNAMVDLIAAKYAAKFVSGSDFTTAVSFTKVVANQTLDDPPSRLRTVRVYDYAGGEAGSNESAQVCYLIDWQTSDGRRGGKPRSYIPGVLDAWVDGEAVINPSQVAELTAKANAYVAEVNALTSDPYTGVEFIDASFVNLKDYRVAPVAFKILGGNCSNAVATQRRRVDRLRTT
jgi:hypothetical protein